MNPALSFCFGSVFAVKYDKLVLGSFCEISLEWNILQKVCFVKLNKRKGSRKCSSDVKVMKIMKLEQGIDTIDMNVTIDCKIQNLFFFFFTHYHKNTHLCKLSSSCFEHRQVCGLLMLCLHHS